MKRWNTVIYAAVLAVLGVFLLYPLADVFREALFGGGAFSLSFAGHVLANPVTRQAIANSLALAVVTTAVCALLAVPLAVLSVRYAFPLKNVLTGLLLLPLVMPPFVGAIGMRQFLGRFGSINLLLLKTGLIAAPVDWLGAARFWGVVIVMALHLFPIMYLNVAAALANIDPSLEEAAANLGSNPWRRFRRVTFPLLMPGFFAGAVIVFIGAFTDLGAPLVFEYRRVIAVQIFDRVTDVGSNPEGSVLVVFVVALTALLFLGAKRLFAREGMETLGKGGSGASEKRAGPIAQVLIPLLFAAILLVACLPHLAVVLTSIQDKWFMTALPESYTAAAYREALSHPLTLSSIRNSIAFSSLSALADLVLGVTVAFLIARARVPGAHLLDALVMLPLAVPGLVLAFGYVGAFSGTVLDPRHNPAPLLVIAYAVRRLPFMARAALAGFQQIHPSLEEAAVNLGSPLHRAIRRVTLPLIGAHLVAGLILAFSFAMLEVSDSLILAIRERFFPITKAIYQLLARIEDGVRVASALGVWTMLFLGLSLLAASVLLGRKMGQLFRA